MELRLKKRKGFGVLCCFEKGIREYNLQKEGKSPITYESDASKNPVNYCLVRRAQRKFKKNRTR